jgi:hypothetical protein
VEAQREAERKGKDLERQRHEFLERTHKLERRIAHQARDLLKLQGEVEEREAALRRLREEHERKLRMLEGNLARSKGKQKEQDKAARDGVMLAGKLAEAQAEVDRLHVALASLKRREEQDKGAEVRRLKDMNRQYQEELRKLKLQSPVPGAGRRLHALERQGGEPLSPTPPTGLSTTQAAGRASAEIHSARSLGRASGEHLPAIGPSPLQGAEREEQEEAAAEATADIQDPELTRQLSQVDVLHATLHANSLDMENFAKFHQRSKALRQARSALEAANREYHELVGLLDVVPEGLEQVAAIEAINAVRQRKEELTATVEVLRREKQEAEVVLDQGFSHKAAGAASPEVGLPCWRRCLMRLLRSGLC